MISNIVVTENDNMDELLRRTVVPQELLLVVPSEQPSQPPSTQQSPQQHTWENMKENTAPLQRGRNISTIRMMEEQQQQQQQQQHQQQQQKECVIDRTIQHYEDQIAQQQQKNSRNSNSSNDDPLQIWLSYIKYLQDVVHIKSTNQCQSLLTVFERCVHTFAPVPAPAPAPAPAPHYQNDVRFIRICCLYADQTYEPLTTFHTLYTQYHIGTQSAVYFNAWAYMAEKLQFYTLAEQIFTTGLDPHHGFHNNNDDDTDAPVPVPVEPYQYLLLRYTRFQKRMSRHWVTLQQQLQERQQLYEGQDDENDDDDTELHTHHVQEITAYHHQYQQHQHQNHHHHPTTTSSNNRQQRGILGPLSSTIHRYSQQRTTTGTTTTTTTTGRILLPQNRTRQQRQQQPSTIRPTFLDRTTNRFTSQQQQQSASSTAFSIFSDTLHPPSTSFTGTKQHRPEPEQIFIKKPSSSLSNSSTHAATIQPLTTEAERYKENRGQIEKWNQSGALSNAYEEPPAHESITAVSSIRNNITGSQYPTITSSSVLHSNTVVGFAIHIDDECIRQQQEEELVRQQQLEQQRMARDDRFVSTKSGTDHKVKDAATVTTTTTKNKQVTKPMWKNRLLTNVTTQQEQSFEEARYQCGYYTILPKCNAINLLCRKPRAFVAIDQHNDYDDDSNEMSMSMEELLSIHDDESFVSGRPITFATPAVSTTTPRPILQTPQPIDAVVPMVGSNRVEHNTNYNNTSTTSSTFEEMNIYGIGGDRNDKKTSVIVNEPTINTQFALRELSFMFASPVPIPTSNAATTIVNPNMSQHDTIAFDQEPNSHQNPRNKNTQPFCAFEVYNDGNDTVVHSATMAQDNNGINFTIFEDKTEPKDAFVRDDRRQPAANNGFTIFCDDSQDTGTGTIPTNSKNDNRTIPIYSDENTETISKKGVDDEYY